jgi:hypothetical protein
VKAKYPEGVQLEYGRDRDADATRTMDALQQETVTLFEATLLVGRRLARADILVKRGNQIRILEVKSKSFDGDPSEFRTTRRPIRIKADWKPYLEDITYQVILLERLVPGAFITPVLVLADKTKTSTLDNIPGLFKLDEREDHTGVTRLHTARYVGTSAQLAQLDLTTEIDVTSEVAELRNEVAAAADLFETRLDEPLRVHLTGLERDGHCRDCEFRAGESSLNGFMDCWGTLALPRPHVLELYQPGRGKAPDGSALIPWMLSRHAASLLDIPLDGIVQSDGNPSGIAARQRRQVEQTRLNQIYVGASLRENIERLRGPIHFIDFETSRLALPYHSGMRPYGLVAFQWSSHTVRELGADPAHLEWLNSSDIWPNQQFAESLRGAIGDEGPVLTWTHFEASTLKEIIADLPRFGRGSDDIAGWMKDVFDRRIVDLNKWARADYYHPGMGGSSSIKRVLEAIWNTDPEMHQQFEQWAQLPANPRSDPYSALPPVSINGVLQDVHEGTGAMRAYEEMMYGISSRDPAAKNAWAGLLQQYCRLDTLSMILILEHWCRQALPH